MIRQWIAQPLSDLATIRARQEAIAYDSLPSLPLDEEELDFLEHYLAFRDQLSIKGTFISFFNSLKLSSDVLTAARHIAHGQPVAYDAGEFSNRFFSYVASFGAFTRASYATPQSVKNALGHTAYLLSGIQELSQIRDIQVKLELDGDMVEGRYIFGAVCNSTSVGGLLTLDPGQVDMRDGKFEILLVRAPKDLVEIAECIQAFQNKTYNCNMVSFRSAQNVKVIMDSPVDWTLDGEQQPGLSQVEICNRHLAYRLLKESEDSL